MGNSNIATRLQIKRNRRHGYEPLIPIDEVARLRDGIQKDKDYKQKERITASVQGEEKEQKETEKRDPLLAWREEQADYNAYIASLSSKQKQPTTTGRSGMDSMVELGNKDEVEHSLMARKAVLDPNNHNVQHIMKVSPSSSSSDHLGSDPKEYQSKRLRREKELIH